MSLSVAPAPSTTDRDDSRQVRLTFRVVRWVRKGGISTLVFALPAVLIFGMFSWWPILRSLLISVQQTNLRTTTWVGLDNFVRVFEDPLLGQATLNTIWYVVLGVLLGFPIPLLLAVFIAELRRTRGLASALAYIPAILPPVVGILLWKEFYNPSAQGVFNTVLGWIGVGPVPWLQDSTLAMPSIVVQATWTSFGTATIIYIAAIRSVQVELYEAAEVDGAGIARRLWHVTLPQLRSIMLILLLLQLIGTVQVFTEPFVMTGGGPVNSTTTLMMLVYRYAFISGDYGRATALSLVLAVALGVLSVLYLWATKKWSTR